MKWIIGIILSVLLTGAVALGGWNLSKTASAPETYATKQELKEATARDRKDHDNIRQEQSQEFDELRTEQRYIRDAVDDIKNILINRGQ
jgi:flagellar basal body-associated protein FliL